MRWRFMGMVMLITALVLLVQTIPLAQYLRSVETDRLLTELERDAFVLAGRAEEALEENDAAGLEGVSLLAQEYQSAGGARVVIVDPAGIVVATSDGVGDALGTNYANRSEVVDALGGEVSRGERFSQTLDESLVYVAVPAFSGDTIVGAVRLTFPATTVDDEVGERLGVIGIVALLTLAVAGFAGLIFSGTVTRRLAFLTATTEQLASGDLRARAEVAGGAPEIARLARSFNVMAERLSALIEQQRAFAADASHQLRTPLTALRLKIERARELIDTDPAGAEARLAAAEREADRLESLIQGLLALGRAGASDAPLATIDLADVARVRATEWTPVATEHSISLLVDAPQEAWARCVSTGAEQIIDNLLDNALAATPNGSHITISVRADDLYWRLGVADEGPGLAEELRTRAFDRFWRAPSAEHPGTGLGLAIVAELTRASGGSATLEAREGGGLEAVVLLPHA